VFKSGSVGLSLCDPTSYTSGVRLDWQVFNQMFGKNFGIWQQQLIYSKQAKN